MPYSVNGSGIYDTVPFELQSLEDTAIVSPLNNQAPVYNSVTNLFENKNIAVTPSGGLTGSLGDVLIEDGVGGIQGTSRLNVDPSNGDISGTLIRADTTDNKIAIGFQAGLTNQSADSIAIGADAGKTNQSAAAIAIGNASGINTQSSGAIAIGSSSGSTGQLANAISIGTNAGNTTQLTSAIAIGVQAGETTQGENAVAIGRLAGKTNQANNSIVISATGSALDNTTANSCKIAPIRLSTGTSQPLTYDDTTNEVFQQTTLTINEASSRVGIGTTTPQEKLDVSGNVIIKNINTDTILSLDSGDNKDCLINMYEDNNIKWTLRNQGDNEDRFFIQSSGGATEKRFTIQQDGNVGIGTTTPSANLHIKKTGEDNSIRIGTNATGNDAYVYFNTNVDWSVGIDNSDGNKFKINNSSSSSGGQTAITIDTNENVGIGTTTPAVRLDVGTGSIRGATEIVNQSTGAISATNCYGDTIYATSSGGTLTLPSGVVGMNLQTINASGGAITLAVQTGEFLDDVLNGTDNLAVSGSKPFIHNYICGATGKWYILH